MSAEPLQRHEVNKLQSFLSGAMLRPGDPRMATVTHFQKRGLLSAKPDRDDKGLFVMVRVSDAGAAALNAATSEQMP